MPLVVVNDATKREEQYFFEVAPSRVSHKATRGWLAPYQMEVPIRVSASARVSAETVYRKGACARDIFLSYFSPVLEAWLGSREGAGSSPSPGDTRRRIEGISISQELRRWVLTYPYPPFAFVLGTSFSGVSYPNPDIRPVDKQPSLPLSLSLSLSFSDTKRQASI